MLENLTVKGGQRYGIFAKKAHHIWIKGCNVSEYGREAVDIRNGKAYSSPTNNSPINYDSGIYLERSGIAVIEECAVHSPNLGANNWSVGHPKGANALQVWAYHDSDAYRGEFIVRNNRFYGAPNHRFNDVIEGRKNFERRGGFVKNSAIYGNYLAYANDDLIEIDGGQQNVLVYGNEMEQGYAGISVAPNMLGPSYIFHNYIHNLGDDRGKEWTAIKAGGLITKPGGKSYIIENYINTNRNGIAASRVNNDSTFWLDVRNNIIVNHLKNNLVGLQVYDKEKYEKSSFINNIFYNKQTQQANIDVSYESLIEHPMNSDVDFIEALINGTTIELPVRNEFLVPNFSKITDNERSINNDTVVSETPISKTLIHLDKNKLSKFSNQAKYGRIDVENNEKITLTGNTWYKHPLEVQLTNDSVLSFNMTVEGDIEIAGIGLETNNYLTQARVFKFAGSQKYGNDFTQLMGGENSAYIELELGQFSLGELKYIVFILDNDDASKQNQSKVSFQSISILDENAQNAVVHENDKNIKIGR